MSSNSIVDIVKELIGEEAAKIISILLEKEETSDDELIQRTGMKINNLRKILYQLFDNNFISYRREKDKEIGWYKYYWRINPTAINILVNSIRKKVLSKLKDRLEYEMNNIFFACPEHQKNRYTFEEAMELNFQCPYCGKKLDNIKNDEIITILKIKISEIEKKLKT
ncbi:MAG: transcription factor E [Candidatus Methanomethylicia archaeon]|jgi:transcription initiation factor TFIIE subunit alpha|uniref:Transcription factor E n=1 Tax=Thermoproteota archaeon TaxID=2056631 RepID=A0A523BAB5_9CREN|nr:transcription factor E [Candidatus Methanomethylicia archaeon]MCQ5340999.1 transcription factor E [Candidatus Methanomethylicia archaeon]NHV45493.1 transcription factor E [Candidatus Verstraetearchaeota archaeon]RZN55499.1 MAG: transcription factor E [Candidatus Verstraetearchaeota archaeon]TDA37889.1 MAG: transcription factor E [Candidatus Verstraetearchaeota archaeon]